MTKITATQSSQWYTANKLKAVKDVMGRCWIIDYATAAASRRNATITLYTDQPGWRWQRHRSRAAKSAMRPDHDGELFVSRLDRLGLEPDASRRMQADS